ncbi:MAG: P27 family phage terminase small subunit [Clostridia bacterium]
MGAQTTGGFRREVVKKMKLLGVYSPAYDITVNILARALYDYHLIMKKIDEAQDGYVVEHTNKAGATNAAKSPLCLAAEGLRKDILAYQRELGLTPSSQKRIVGKHLQADKPSSLASMLEQLES